MRSPVPCIRLSPTLPYLLPPLLSERRLLSIRFIRSFLEESVYQVNPIPLNGEHEIRRTLSAPSLSIFLLALFLRVTKQRFSGLAMEYLVFLELNRVKRWTRKEGCMIERSYRLSWIDRRKLDGDGSVIKIIPFSFFLFRALNALPRWEISFVKVSSQFRYF